MITEMKRKCRPFQRGEIVRIKNDRERMCTVELVNIFTHRVTLRYLSESGVIKRESMNMDAITGMYSINPKIYCQ